MREPTRVPAGICAAVKVLEHPVRTRQVRRLAGSRLRYKDLVA